VLYGDRIAVPQVNGLSMDAAKSALTAAGFQVSISTTGIPSDQPVGTVADSSPHQGQRATPGATVTLFPSLGPVASPPTGGPGGNQGGGGGQPGGQPTNPGQGGGGGHGGGGGGGG
jgi:beta-lactam-binding protein with PASTA domain